MSNSHNFWSTQPIKVGEGNGTIQVPEEIRKEPIKLPDPFVFKTFNFEKDINALYLLLKENYVEDLASDFRLEYSRDFLAWQLNDPKAKPEYAVCLLHQTKLVGFALGKELILCVSDKVENFLSVNFLCIDRNLRNQRLAPVIIQELTRRANLNGIFHAIFTSGKKLPFDFASSRYYHRPINTKKLIDVEFCVKPEDENEMIEYFQINYKIRPGIRQMQNGDLPKVFELYKQECKKYDLYQVYDFKDFEYNFKNRENIFYTYVNEEEGEIKEFFSFFVINSLLVKDLRIKVKTAYIFYYSTDNTTTIMQEMISEAKNQGCDLVNSLLIMKNELFLEDLNFLPGNGVLNYYFFNWKTKSIENEKIFFILP
ncbi:glycylpeptide N-tetradecanoyltransferase [Hamiltosporidium tvaerminnensis]|uniref:Glycylpeptide N-tetradecanoyltransferase n=2 Tax=Hamiltosporidium TaxID=1176354 RepID=A0A4Q9LJS9_9MICR|nr:glycylpeptide N-tetradecanoyltransferase [Hamiltosporidium tvaerminnensis]TBU01678.1 glycylpeptide N-tetradecanoyltransferase [Hamiltosporidium tvaerminnensis]TBU07041.1 glycylpeptide N-tetradecanoyltransferase [Hamiltosporidium magnivora]TBU08463.1 glycylpeptide N-tetradecanoyltransferase [Hamiltosporidium magnivora]TBU19862.1 glycylpeptide N-tetradecanoyltransferase [Hamiltosporidium tvaerminnensis]